MSLFSTVIADMSTRTVLTLSGSKNSKTWNLKIILEAVHLGFSISVCDFFSLLNKMSKAKGLSGLFKLLGFADDASDLGKAGKAADSAGDLGKAADSVDDLGDLGKAGDAAGAIGDGKRAADAGADTKSGLSNTQLAGVGVASVMGNNLLGDLTGQSATGYFFDGVQDIGDEAGGTVSNMLYKTIIPIFLLIGIVLVLMS